ncbi:MAG: hypothetical protein LQ342_008022 [Letrouitia transgressa]|nr:MAG: hypothetical protein LQ342_008022 [Letrouitia transgressa]
MYVPARPESGGGEGELWIDTPLKPFYKSAGNEDKDFWDSADARDWAQCGFAIPGTDRNTDKDALKKVVEDYIRDNYLWIAYPAVKPDTYPASDKEALPADVKDHLNLEQFPQQTIDEAVISHGTPISISKNTLLMGHSTSTSSLDLSVPPKTAGTLYGDVVTLTSELTKYLQSNTVDVGVPNHLRILESLDPEKVVPYLTENLNWRITTPSGELKSKEAVRDSGLEIKVMSRWYNIQTRDKGLGSYDEPILHEAITHRKTGGYSE